MINKSMFFSNADNWGTPQKLFDEINEEFHFTLDAAADETNHKCDRFFTKEMDGLTQLWEGSVWVNPPYGRQIGKWVEKAYTEKDHCAVIVMLLPARTDTRWFHNFILGKAEIRWIKGRIKFEPRCDNAPFPSMIVIFRREE